jgi:hypothetical protein
MSTGTKFGNIPNSVILFPSYPDTIQGKHLYRKVRVYTKPDSNFTLEIIVNFDEEKILPKAMESNKFNNLTLKLSLYSRPCLVGEILSTSDESCYKCPEGEFSLIDPMNETNNGSQQTCRPCDQNAYCESGSDLSPNYGYWRFSAQSSRIVECFSKIFCLGGQSSSGSPKESKKIFI